MTTTNHALNFIEYLEAEARTLSTKAGERRDLADQLRKTFDLLSVTSPGPAPAERSVPQTQGSASAGAAPVPSTVPTIAGYQRRILKALEDGPKRSLEMKPKDLHKREWPVWAKAVKQLLKSGAVTVSGNRTGAKYALATKKPTAQASQAKPASAGEWPTGPIYVNLRQAFVQVHPGDADRRELLVAVRKQNASFEYTHVEHALKALVSAGLVRMKPSPAGDRFVMAARG